MSRTPGERSRGGRSPRADRAGRIRRPSTPDPLVQEALVLVVPAGHSRLADEAGHDDEAGTVLGHHDGAVHDVEAPAQASSQHKTACGSISCCATFVEHKEGVQQARDEQQQQRSGQRDGRTPRDGAQEPAHPSRRARATRSLPAASHRAALVTFFREVWITLVNTSNVEYI